MLSLQSWCESTTSNCTMSTCYKKICKQMYSHCLHDLVSVSQYVQVNTHWDSTGRKVIRIQSRSSYRAALTQHPSLYLSTGEWLAEICSHSSSPLDWACDWRPFPQLSSRLCGLYSAHTCFLGQTQTSQFLASCTKTLWTHCAQF